MLKQLLLLTIYLVIQPVTAEEIHREKSLYRNIVVKEYDGRRCLVFAIKRNDHNQTCMDLTDPKRLVFPYARMMLGGLLLNSAPENVLIIGLGGGSIPIALAELYPLANIDIVEIDDAVVRVAKMYFYFSESQRMKVHVTDARVFIKRANLRQQQYDLIILDAFTGEYIPEHLMTQEFLQETKSLLTDSGTLVANTFSTSSLYDHESVTYQTVFGDFLNFKMPNTGNRVILASMQPLPSLFTLRGKAKHLSAQLDNYDVDIESYPAYMNRAQDWDQAKRPLTDQYNPANLLQGRP